MFRIILASIVLVSCAYKTDYILLTRGSLEKEEARENYVVQYGVNIPLPLRRTFIKGSVVEGMTRQLVEDLYGPPDYHNFYNDIWEYEYENKVILHIEFSRGLYNGDEVVSVRYD